MAYIMLFSAEAECRFLLPGMNDQIDAAITATRRRDPEMFAKLESDPALNGYRERISAATPKDLRPATWTPTSASPSFNERSMARLIDAGQDQMGQYPFR